MLQVPISVLIPAKNEQIHIAACIRSAAWANEVVVVDSHSVDDTCVIATSLGARVIQFDYRPGGLKKKNWALDNIDFRHDWILILDADERVTCELAAEIANVISRPGTPAGFYINRRFYFLNQWIRHCGYFPSWNLRLFRRDLGRYEVLLDAETNSGDNEVHEHVVLKGHAGHLRCPMDHYAYLSIDQFIQKHLRYADWEARLGSRLAQPLQRSDARSPIETSINLRRRLKAVARHLPFAPLLRFWYHYFLRLGALDGANGYILCRLLAEYEFLIWAKRHEQTAGRSRPALPDSLASESPHP